MRALWIGLLVASAGVAHADRDLCQPGTRFRGATLDLDVKNAEIHDVYRLLSDVGKVNIVLPDEVSGKVTMRLKRVPWDQIACTVAAVHRLAISVNGNVLLVTRREPAKR
jgi:type II secretory pathway component HofQ